MKKLGAGLVAGLFLFGWMGLVQAATSSYSFSGSLSFLGLDNGLAVYSGSTIGTEFYGEINVDLSFPEDVWGFIANGTTRIDFGESIAAGGLSISDNISLDEETADELNSVFGDSKYSVGNVLDIITIEGDTSTTGSGRIEIGLSFILDSGSFGNTDVSNYPPDPTNIEDVLFFIVEEDGVNEIYYGAGPITAVPLPTSIWLLGCGIAVLVRRKRSAL